MREERGRLPLDRLVPEVVACRLGGSIQRTNIVESKSTLMEPTTRASHQSEYPSRQTAAAKFPAGGMGDATYGPSYIQPGIKGIQGFRASAMDTWRAAAAAA